MVKMVIKVAGYSKGNIVACA